MRVNHIGIVVKDINKSANIYSNLGYKIVSDIIYDHIQHNKILFMMSNDYTQKIELIEVLDNKSTVYHAKKGYHHICYELDSTENFKEIFNKMKIGKIITAPISAPALDKRNVIFAYLKNDTIIEFLL